MNLNTVVEVRRPASADEITQWRDGYAWLAGGTWLFSEPQWTTDTLIDLDQLRWPALATSPAGLDIAATCLIAELYRFVAPEEWTAAPLLRECSNAFLASFKIWNAATVGGNICMSLPAGPMISLTVALEATYMLWPRGAAPRKKMPGIAFVTGATMPMCCSRANCCAASTSRSRRCRSVPRFAMHPLTKLGRSAATDHRNADAGVRRPADHYHGGDASAGAAAVRAAAICCGTAPRHRCPYSR